MSTNADNVRVAVTGAVSVGDDSATAPTGTASSLASYEDLGGVSEDGLTITHPDAGDATTIKFWQNGQQARVIRASADDLPTYQFVLLETKKEVIEAKLGVTVTQTSTEGSYVIDTSVVQVPKKWVFDMIDGENLRRDYVPKGTVTAIGDQVWSGTEAIGHEITVEAERSTEISGNVKIWDTALKSVA